MQKITFFVPTLLSLLLVYWSFFPGPASPLICCTNYSEAAELCLYITEWWPSLILVGVGPNVENFIKLATSLLLCWSQMVAGWPFLFKFHITTVKRIARVKGVPNIQFHLEINNDILTRCLFSTGHCKWVGPAFSGHYASIIGGQTGTYLAHSLKNN